MSINNTDIFFSVIICCYNSERYIRETIDSVISQTHKNWEIVIVNDGSTDSTEEIILNYKNKGINIIYTKQENLGFAAARNKAISLANAEWIAIIDHDDICLPDRLEIQSTQIVSNPESKLFFGDCLYFDDLNVFNRQSHYIKNKYKYNINNFKFSSTECFNNLAKYGCFISSSTVIFNKNSSVEIGNFNINFKTVADYDFFLKLSKKYSFSYSNQILTKWRTHKFQTSKLSQYTYFMELNLLLFKLIFNKYISFFNKISIIKRLFFFNSKILYKFIFKIKEYTYEKKYFS